MAAVATLLTGVLVLALLVADVQLGLPRWLVLAGLFGICAVVVWLDWAVVRRR